MTIYTVLAPPAEPGSDGTDPDGFVFVKEGFCWPALYLTAPWLLWQRMWLAFVVYIAATLGIFSLVERVDIPVAWLIHVLFGFLVALEANNLRRWTLERRGYRFWASYPAPTPVRPSFVSSRAGSTHLLDRHRQSRRSR